MRAVHTLPAAAAGILGALLLAAPVAHAQVKAAGSPDNELKHGQGVVLTLKDGKKVTGTYIRTAGGTMYVRTVPRTLPTAVSSADVTKTDPIVVVPVQGRAQGAYGPEIHRVTISNGPEVSVRYVAPNLSPGELESLAQLEAAENEYARLNNMAALGQEYLRDEASLEKFRYEAERNYYRFSALGAMGFYPGTALTPFPNYGYVNFAGAPYYATRSLYSGSGYVQGSFVPGASWAVPTAPGWYGGSSYPPPPGNAMGDEGVIKTTLAANLAKAMSPEAVGQARQNLEVARSRVIYDGDQIVAVTPAEPANIKGAANK